MSEAAKEHDPLKHFDERSAHWNSLYERAQFRDRLSLFRDGVKAHVAPKGKILDYGCGTGMIALELARNGYNLTAVDGARGMVEQGRQAAQEEGLGNISFTHIEQPEHWQPEGKYDGIVCSSVIEYVPDDLGLVRKFADALNPGGWLLVSIPSGTSWVGKLEDLIGKFKGERRDVEFAQRRYALDEFYARLAAMGLRQRQTTCFEFPVLGSLGVTLSRIPIVGVMALVVAQKDPD